MDDTDVFAERAREGDDGSFAALYGRLAPALYAWATYRLRGPVRKSVDPEDLVQEVWWRALEGFPRFEARGRGAFRAWVFSIATNVYRETVRRGFRESGPDRDGRVESLPPELHAQMSSISNDLARHDDAIKLVESMAGFDPDDRKLVLYVGLEGLPVKEAATLLRIQPENAKKRWQRLRARLEDIPAWKSLLEPT